MIKPIVTDVIFLGGKSQPAVPEDIPAADDLLDTLRANRDRCVGMAANMIGIRKAIIAVEDRGRLLELFNPQIIARAGAYETEEGCLSLPGTRPVRRWRSVKVRWQTRAFQTRTQTFTGLTAQIIQHEIDHLNGIII